MAFSKGEGLLAPTPSAPARAWGQASGLFQGSLGARPLLPILQGLHSPRFEVHPHPLPSEAMPHIVAADDDRRDILRDLDDLRSGEGLRAVAVEKDAAAKQVSRFILHLPPIGEIGCLPVVVVQQRDIEAVAALAKRLEGHREHVGLA